jgi:hypothetical protein
MEGMTVVFRNAPKRWVDAFLESWAVEAQRFIDAIRQTMAFIRVEMAPETRHSPSLVDTWKENVLTVQRGIGRIVSVLDESQLNLGRIKLGQVIPPRSVGIPTAGFNRPVASSYNDNRSVEMVLNNNLDVDNMRRIIGRTLEGVGMGQEV